MEKQYLIIFHIVDLLQWASRLRLKKTSKSFDGVFQKMIVSI